MSMSAALSQNQKMASLIFPFYFLILFHLFNGISLSHSIVKYLPGFQGPLPFYLETGYIGVGDSDSENVQLFYYFVKSERDPENDPLILWLTGGPGCTGFSGFAMGMGPLHFKQEEYNGSLPTLILNPYAWTKRASMIFIDSPVETGFSYAETPQSRKTGDLIQAHQSHQFLVKWLIDHPEFLSNPFYVGGDSYAGLIVPIVVQEIINGNEHTLPFVNLQGYILGNPFTVRSTIQKFQVHFSHRMTLISDELFQSLERSCGGEYVNINPSNIECLKHYKTYNECTSRILLIHILMPYCDEETSPPPRRSLHGISEPILAQKEPSFNIDCPNYMDVLFNNWGNDARVWKALHIREGTIRGYWIRCYKYLDYNNDVDSVIPYHLNISSRGYRSLIYSGDHDMMISHLDTEAWIKLLNYSIVDEWRPWFIDDQIAGYTRTYSNKMTYVTIKGGGHIAHFTPKQSGEIFSRWIAGESL